MNIRNQQLFKFSDIPGGASLPDILVKALSWADTFTCFHFLTDNGIGTNYPFGGFARMLAVGEVQSFVGQKGQIFNDLQDFMIQHVNEWIFGYFGYDLKNEIEELTSLNPDFVQFQQTGFYIPEHLIFFHEDHVDVHSSGDPAFIWQQIIQTNLPVGDEPVFVGSLQQRTLQQQYVHAVEQLKEHILEGDVYEINYCMEFFAEHADLHPLSAYLALNRLSPMPFSVFGKMNQQYILCASPERFLKKTGNRLVSMPIKGTVRRGLSLEEDTSLKDGLRNSEKERAENMMIVDLVRNDLARSAVPGTVTVEEMFGIYSFAALHQMISTVSAEIRPEIEALQTIRNAFPMGSMTGAPKVKAMELIDQYEAQQRSLYSGAFGYFAPNGDFDFNVVIRSILYNAATKYLSFSVGSAITYDSVPEKEYEECLLKAATMRKVLTGM